MYEWLLYICIVVQALWCCILGFFVLECAYVYSYWKRFAYDAGKQLEECAAKKVQKYLGGRTLRSVLLPTDGRNTTEADIIHVCSRGIFVIECKMRSSGVSGDVRDDIWRSGKSTVYQMENPIKQNFYHIVAVRNALRKAGISYEGPIYNVVLLNVWNVRVSGVETIEDTFLLNGENKLRRLRKLPKADMPKEQIDAIAELFAGMQATEETMKAHVERLQEKYGSA